MATKFSLTPTGAGTARLDLAGETPPRGNGAIEIAVQRGSDEACVGTDGTWQKGQQAWHRLERLGGQEDPAYLVGPAVVDALAAVAHSDAFLVFARWQEGGGDGVLRIVKALIGTEAKIGGASPPPPPPDPESESGGPPPIPNPNSPADTKPPILPQAPRFPLPWMLGALATVIILAGLWALWPNPATVPPGAGLPEQTETAANPTLPGQTPGPESPPGIPAIGADVVTPQAQDDLQLEDDRQPTPSSPGKPSPPTPASPPSATGHDQVGPQASQPQPPSSPLDAPQIKGPEYVNWLVEQKPDAQTYRDQADKRARQGDCPAVILLYDRAARASPEIAAQVARLYDPEGFRPTPCIDQPSLANAREYRELAAGRAIPVMQSPETAPQSQTPAPPPEHRTWENRQ